MHYFVTRSILSPPLSDNQISPLSVNLRQKSQINQSMGTSNLFSQGVSSFNSFDMHLEHPGRSYGRCPWLS